MRLVSGRDGFRGHAHVTNLLRNEFENRPRLLIARFRILDQLGDLFAHFGKLFALICKISDLLEVYTAFNYSFGKISLSSSNLCKTVIFIIRFTMSYEYDPHICLLFGICATQD